MDITGSIAKRMVESSITVPVYFGGNEIRLNILIDVLYKYFLVRLSLLRSYALLCFCISYFKIQEKKKGVTMGLLKYLISTLFRMTGSQRFLYCFFDYHVLSDTYRTNDGGGILHILLFRIPERPFYSNKLCMAVAFNLCL
ncbi:MAG: hypothetical protein A3C80_02630 [Candidatus Ryanbacteria bacterium RIFCSPHIGHO2_02_FULL_45_43]|uniref:Uncharacterized protein n=1 Tax=Candidatus Ryanbacteria bacterium RIFCSPHIGHO2_01_45_13 TaxID=1802112 RepID=A0A1G2FZI0_9BACT|nr:MAG: hypothetical protein A2718_01045 [Candidatus Ryanbacteria bacterium RIFCSPHIGHO2_01_FULL_44_130]OGZ43495.1 MAG: hypothetical protein A2W41_04120 [Candidatus Ryanbacteria bacterium RIFCSPHIGHO2_01_45_13]OGZ47839.1 MAG: hypothetical protein A3C80_02630 [Candidatus Ryanbacteria bacterium RIFCSPHIGHO2_02_FULL_45_43]OGZ49884.1 MAG: hypothetical protein A3E55_03665 [Candidatus Ryanbacteria bacterium RIFCSPHIGHO2_12_FULL_44_20]OGZ50994.1 MAG: hypothetical protein A3A17_03205 [Candidatus Ryanba